ncbi:MAG: hypothetical protein NT069_05025, partial [Planctomycetota bacterium]|nr:hypothetical protein [Planctomycetota bacterium]
MRHLARGTTIWNLSEPPAEPDLVDQKDALRKGLGRAALWAQAGQLDHALLHAACLSDWRYDKQSDDNRATYLWKLLELTGMRDELRFPVLHRLGESVDPDITWQMYGLAYQYASAGDTLHRQAIYAHYARLCRLDKGWSPDGYVLALDGFAGFEFCLAQRAAALRSRDWVWEDEALISTAKEEFGQDRIDRYLDESRDPDIIRFRDRLRLEGHSD